jgi:ATP-binding cassette subfamily C (CFTR/MRP) protein 1
VLQLQLLILDIEGISLLGELILTCVSSGYLAVSIPVLFLALFYIQRFYLRTSRQLRLLDLEAKSPLYSFFISSFTGLTTIRAYLWSNQTYKEHLRRLNISQQPFYALYCVQRWLMMVLELVVAGLCILLLGIAVSLRDTINPGLLGVALTSVTNFGLTLTQFIQIWTDLETSLGAITRIRQFQADTPQEPSGLDLPPDVPGDNRKWPADGAISFSGLGAKYGTHTVLSNVDLAIKPGEKVAICGRSGSGKSTLLALLLRMYEPSHGSITIDGVDISTLQTNALRESLVALPQDPLLLAGTVRYNLDPASRVSDELILAALGRTGIRSVIDDKGGLDAEFNADWLSAGQKQLFCLARVMLRREGRVLLLDEATSRYDFFSFLHSTLVCLSIGSVRKYKVRDEVTNCILISRCCSLDHGTDELIQTLLRTEFAGWTMVVVAHRLKTVADFDKIVVLQDGQVAEVGNPGELLKVEGGGGIFRGLWNMQEA